MNIKYIPMSLSFKQSSDVRERDLNVKFIIFDSI